MISSSHHVFDLKFALIIYMRQKTIDKYWYLLIPSLVKKMRDSFDRDRAKRKKEGKEGTLKDQVT